MFDQINKALLWLKNNNKINDYQYNVLQNYYRKNNNINVEVLRDELFKLGTDPSYVLSKISQIEDSNIDVIEFDDFNIINSDNASNFSNEIPNNQFNDTSINIVNQVNNLNDNQSFALQEMNWIRGLHPDKIVNMTSKPHSYVLSGDGIEDIYVKVEGKNGIYQILPDIEMYTSDSVNDTSVSNQSESKGISLTKSTLAGRAMADKDQAAFTNILFFIFLSGLSVGVVFMVILNFFIK